MKNTKIQWCCSTVNPVMGCSGCELWPSATRLKAQIVEVIPVLPEMPPGMTDTHVNSVIGNRATSAIYDDREQISKEIDARLNV